MGKQETTTNKINLVFSCYTFNDNKQGTVAVLDMDRIWVCMAEQQQPANLTMVGAFGLKLWTFFPKTTRHFDKSAICGFWPDKIHISKYLWPIWLFFYLWIVSELSRNIYIIRKMKFWIRKNTLCG